jgi:hypothetical protein
VGSLALTVPGLSLGDVPLVVTSVAPPPPLDEGGSWWSRAATAVLDAGGSLVHELFG